jgi:hypothetical protein
MLGQNARNPGDRHARRIIPSARGAVRSFGIRSESAPRRTERDWSDEQDDDDDPDSVLGVQVSLVDAMRSIRAAGVAGGHGGGAGGTAGGGAGDEAGGGSGRGGGRRGQAEDGGPLDEQGTNPVGGTTASDVGETGGGSAADIGGIGGSGGGSAMGGQGDSST